MEQIIEQLKDMKARIDDQKSTAEDEKQKNLTFTLDKEVYGIQIESITQIINMVEITFVPHQPYYVKGVINIRGLIVPVIEVRSRFNKPTTEYDDRSCIIVVNKEDMLVGLIVDRISEVYNIGMDEISPTPDVNKETAVKYIRGVAHSGDTVITLLDIDKLLDHDGF